MLLAPLTRFVFVSEFASVRLYPEALFVLTVTVSLELLTTPPDVGVKLTVTVVDVVTLIAEPTDALIVVFAVCVAAEANAGVTAIPSIDRATAPLVTR
jgi:hypothetical protein